MPEFSLAYWAFLSYSSHDRETARWLHRSLETYAVPGRLVGRPTPVGPAPKRFRPIFRDRTELAADSDLDARIRNALAQSAYLIVICSPHAAKSRWVDKEIAYFRVLHDGTRIFSVIVDGSLTDPDQDCFPPALRYRGDFSADARGPEPIAVDLRPRGDGRRMARLKLVAGMLGVGLDELVRRDAQRRHRRLVIVTAASVAGMTVMGALATAAFIARNDAQKQRGHAEGLIEFMLTDLRKKLEPSGRLELMDGVGSEALKYYGAQNPSDLDAQSLARRARALRLMGEIALQRGNLDEALQSFEQASATTEELLARSPGDGQSTFNHAQNVFWVGEIARQRGGTAKAEASFQEYRRLADRLVAIDPGNHDWRAEVGYAQSALGILYLQEGRAANAIIAFQDSLSVVESLASLLPDDTNVQIELGQGHAWLADALQQQGRLAETRSHREKELVIYQSILAKDAGIRQAKFSTISALLSLGRLKMIDGDLQGALKDFSNAVERAEALLVDERDNMDLTGVVAIAQVDLGEVLLATDQVSAAQSAQKRAAMLLDAALRHDDTVALWRSYRDSAVLLEATIAARMGERSRALQLDEDSLNRLEATVHAGSNTDPFWLLQRFRLQTGDDLSALGRQDDARKKWEAILRSLPGPIESYEPRLLMVLETADARLARPAAAASIAKHLRAMSNPRGGG
jgi:tetratricopeptide (TPR) repeat protein